MLNEKSVRAAIGFGEVIRTGIYALLIALAIRTLAYEPFSVPSESMLPTLLVGDYFFVSKYSYGYSRHSLPFSPDFFEGRIMEGVPQRGDIAVFKTPADDQTDFVKRIIGLPGDTIQMREGTLYLNGVEARRERVEDFHDVDLFGNVRLVPQYRETLPSGVSYMVLDIRTTPQDNTEIFMVRPGHYFAMGDNRDNSQDSRFNSLGAVGQIPAENLVGRAEILFFSTDRSGPWWQVWRWPVMIRYSRIFDSLRT
jgi:signal peptidase I